MIVFKFGGASVCDASSVRNVAAVVRNYTAKPLIVVVSAMGKTTNRIEEYVRQVRADDPAAEHTLNLLRSFHMNILYELFPAGDENAIKPAEAFFNEIEQKASQMKAESYDCFYDQVVSYGEMISSTILSCYFLHAGLAHELLDARELIHTLPPFREALVDWGKTHNSINRAIDPSKSSLWITQGFIGGYENYTTTLGREGSDYSAAILAWATEAESLTIWKDVPGLLNADPKYFNATKLLEHISYNEAIELAYYGATIIHPKTIKPLQNKNIPLYVRSFLDYSSNGSVIDRHAGSDQLTPSFIFKPNQTLISISARDFSFIAEENLSYIFSRLAAFHIRVNLMQNSAISFSVCIDQDDTKTEALIQELQTSYKVRYNKGLHLITIRHYTEELIEALTGGREVLLEQRSRSTCQLIVKAE